MNNKPQRPAVSISRPSLPTSSSDFALPSSPSTVVPPTASDDLSPFLLRLRRPSMLGPRGVSQPPHDARLHSPLVTSFTRRYSSSGPADDSESDRDKMSTDSDSGHATPLLPGPQIDCESDASMKTVSRPRTPPRMTSASSSSSGNEDAPPMRAHHRKLSHPVGSLPFVLSPSALHPSSQPVMKLMRARKQVRAPRILALVADSHVEDSEVHSEAQFQRLLASFSESPAHPRTPRVASDRGRYPEEAGGDEPQRESTPSDDEELDDLVPFALGDSTAATKPVTPAQSVNGDELSMLESPIGMAMDVDMPSSAVSSPIISSWRYTPPPTATSAVRSNKRKLEDRYDPYPSAAKRRAVSPSISHLRESFSGRLSGSAPRLSMPIPIPIPNGVHSGSSSPIVPGSSSYWSARQSFGSASASVLSSPTLRAQIGLASPILRPMTRARREGEREVDGAEEGVHSLTIG